MADAPADAPAAEAEAPADAEPAASAPADAAVPTDAPSAAPVQGEAAAAGTEAEAAGGAEAEAEPAPDATAAAPAPPAIDAALSAFGGGASSSPLLKKFKKAGKKAQLGTRFATMSRSRIAVQLAAELQQCTPELLAEIQAADDETVRSLSEKLNDQIPKVITDPGARGWFKLFQQMDADGSGKIAFDEFAGMGRKEVRVSVEDVPTELLLGVWKVLDADGSGLIQVRTCARAAPAPVPTPAPVPAPAPAPAPARPCSCCFRLRYRHPCWRPCLRTCRHTCPMRDRPRHRAQAGEFGQFMKLGQPEKGKSWRERNAEANKSRRQGLDEDMDARVGREVTRKLESIEVASEEEVLTMSKLLNDGMEHALRDVTPAAR